METPDPPNDTPGALKQVVLTPHDIPWSLRVDGLWHPFRKPCNPHWISNGLVFLLEDFLVWARDLHVWIGVVAKTTGHFSGRRDEKPVWTCGISDPPAKNRQQVGFLRCISGTWNSLNPQFLSRGKFFCKTSSFKKFPWGIFNEQASEAGVMCSSPYFRHFNETRNVVVLYTWMQVFVGVLWSFFNCT